MSRVRRVETLWWLWLAAVIVGVGVALLLNRESEPGGLDREAEIFPVTGEAGESAEAVDSIEQQGNEDDTGVLRTQGLVLDDVLDDGSGLKDNELALNPVEIREWRGRLEPSISVLGREFLAGNPGNIRLGLAGALDLDLEVLNYQASDETSGVLTARVLGDPYSLVVLAHVGNAQSGTVHMPAAGRVFEVRYGGQPGEVVVSEIDMEALDERMQLPRRPDEDGVSPNGIAIPVQE